MAVSAKAVDVTAELWRIVERGDVEALSRFLPRVADVNARNRFGMTVLMKAACCGDARMVRLLLEHGADPNLIRNDKFTALALAAFFGYSDTVKTLLEFGAHSDAVTRCGASARTWATARTFAEVARCLETPRVETHQQAPVQLRNSSSPKSIVALGICAIVVLIVCCGVGALILRSSEAHALPPPEPATTLSTVENKVVTPPPVQPASTVETKVVTPPPVQQVVAESAVGPVKKENLARPVLKKLAPPQREVRSVSEVVKPVSEVSVAPAEPVQITKPSKAAAPKFESSKPAPLSPQIIAPSKKAKVIQWP